jgi:hypothetical protein
MSVAESEAFSSKLICTFISSSVCCIVGVSPVFGLDQVSCEAGIGKEIVLPELPELDQDPNPDPDKI